MTDSVISRFEIQMDAGNEPVFKGGEVITGKLLIELRQPIVINAVKLQMKGRGVWINDPIKKEDIEKVLFDNDFTLLERPPGKPEAGHFTWIADYTYSLPFECPLPKGCPTSYEGPHAFIRYFIRASLVQEDEHGKIHDYYVKRAFSIVSPSEGHLVIGEAQTTSETAVYGKCCCKGKLTAELSLPKSGYLPGEDVIGNLKIGNKHPKDILQHMEVRLVDRVQRVGAPEKVAASPWRTLLYTKLDHEGPVPKSAIQKDAIRLLTIPAVCPTTKGDFDSVTNEIHAMSPIGRLLESPSTATLKFRRKPFLRIEYAIQVSLGTHLLMELPIDIGEHSTRDKEATLKPFICGAQPLEEKDETGKISIDGPFMYTPVYPFKENVVSRVPEGQAYVPSITTISEEPVVVNGSAAAHSVTETRVTEESQSEEGAHEKSVVTTTKTIVTHVDGHETKTMEETVVEKDGGVTRTVEETVLSEDGIEKRRIEETTIDEGGHESTLVVEDERALEEGDAEIPEEVQEARDRIEELAEAADDSKEAAVTSDATTTVTTTEGEEGEETIVSTEVFEEGESKTIRTTTVTKHADGSESTMVQEHTTSHGGEE